MDYEALCNVALEGSRLAALAIMEVRKKGFEKWDKSDSSPVTEADYASNDVLMSALKPLGIPILSEEEKETQYQDRKDWQSFWLVDPLDGTKEFIKGLPEFTINVALVHEGEPVLGIIAIPSTMEVFYGHSGKAYKALFENKGVSGIRQIGPSNPTDHLVVATSRSHLSPDTKAYIDSISADYSSTEIVQAGSALKFCLIAEGSAHVYPRYTPCMEWDTAAAHAILKSVGRNIVRMSDKEQLEYNKESLLNPPFLAQ